MLVPCALLSGNKNSFLLLWIWKPIGLRVFISLDVETEMVFFRDPDDDVIKSWKEDDNGEWKLCAVDLTTFRIGRFKKMLLHEFARIEKERQEKEQREEENYDTIIRHIWMIP